MSKATRPRPAVARRYTSHVPLPASAKTSGIVIAGVVVGAMVETDCASTSSGERTPCRSPYASSRGRCGKTVSEANCRLRLFRFVRLEGLVCGGTAGKSRNSALGRVRSMNDYEAMLAVAIKEARQGLAEGGIPIGAAIFDQAGKLVASGHNRRVQHGDPSAHGETDAFRNAGRQRSYRNLIMVTTLAPCWYCSGLIRQFGFRTVIIGESQTFEGGIHWLRDNGIEVHDLASPECIQLMTDYIRANPE